MDTYFDYHRALFTPAFNFAVNHVERLIRTPATANALFHASIERFRLPGCQSIEFTPIELAERINATLRSAPIHVISSAPGSGADAGLKAMNHCNSSPTIVIEPQYMVCCNEDVLPRCVLLLIVKLLHAVCHALTPLFYELNGFPVKGRRVDPPMHFGSVLVTLPDGRQALKGDAGLGWEDTVLGGRIMAGTTAGQPSYDQPLHILITQAPVVLRILPDECVEQLVGLFTSTDSSLAEADLRTIIAQAASLAPIVILEMYHRADQLAPNQQTAQQRPALDASPLEASGSSQQLAVVTPFTPEQKAKLWREIVWYDDDSSDQRFASTSMDCENGQADPTEGIAHNLHDDINAEMDIEPDAAQYDGSQSSLSDDDDSSSDRQQDVREAINSSSSSDESLDEESEAPERRSAAVKQPTRSKPGQYVSSDSQEEEDETWREGASKVMGALGRHARLKTLKLRVALKRIRQGLDNKTIFSASLLHAQLLDTFAKEGADILLRKHAHQLCLEHLPLNQEANGDSNQAWSLTEAERTRCRQEREAFLRTAGFLPPRDRYQPCHKLLSELEQCADADAANVLAFFQTLQLEGVPDYLQYVEFPMDLTTVRYRLAGRLRHREHAMKIMGKREASRYESYAAFLDELRMVFTNAIAYNGVHMDEDASGISLTLFHTAHMYLDRLEELIPVFTLRMVNGLQGMEVDKGGDTAGASPPSPPDTPTIISPPAAPVTKRQTKSKSKRQLIELSDEESADNERKALIAKRKKLLKIKYGRGQRSQSTMEEEDELADSETN